MSEARGHIRQTGLLPLTVLEKVGHQPRHTHSCMAAYSEHLSVIGLDKFWWAPSVGTSVQRIEPHGVRC